MKKIKKKMKSLDKTYKSYTRNKLLTELQVTVMTIKFKAMGIKAKTFEGRIC